MKKKLLVGFLAVAVIVGVALYLVTSNLGGVVKKAIEVAGPKITQTPVTVDKVHLSPSSGSGSIEGFVLGNPAGYTGPHAMRVGSARLEVDPASVLSDKIHVRSIAVSGLEVVIEGGLGDNNLQQILANIDRFTAGEKTSEGSKKKKIQVDDFLLTGTKVDVKLGVLAGKGVSLTLPDIHLTNLGSGGDGMSPGELSRKVFGEAVDQILPAVAAKVAQSGNLGKGLGKDAVDAAKGLLDKAAGGVGDLFKKKK